MSRFALLLTIFCGVILAPIPSIAQSANSAMDIFGLDAARGDFFSRADRDGDFALSSAELSDALAFSASHAFDGKDTDGDGFISYSEYLDFGSQVFGEMDLNGDGILSPDEM